MAKLRDGYQAQCPQCGCFINFSSESMDPNIRKAMTEARRIRNGFIAESANIEEIDPEIADAPIVRSRVDNAKLERVLSNSFGFGGTNATLVFQRTDA